MSLVAQIGSGAAIGAAVLLLALLLQRPRGAEQVMVAVFLGAYGGVIAFELLHFGTLFGPSLPPYHILVLLPLALFYTAAAIRTLVLRRHDGDALAGQSGGGQPGHVVRRGTVPLRARAVVLAIFWTIFVLGGGFHAVRAVLGGEA